jgi:L-amino acid N-acyltransferase YncA
MNIRPMLHTDAQAVLRIYQAGIDSGNASFESTAPSWDAFDAGKLTDHRYVAVDNTDAVLGWVSVSAVSSRCVYAGVVEHSVSVDPACRRRVVGVREKVGRHESRGNRWRDVVFIERRSPLVS